MGAEKFFDIKCRVSGLKPDAAVLVATIRALKMHGGVGRIVAGRPLDPALETENVEAVRAGCANLAAQIEVVRLYEVPVVVAINSFPTDTAAEVEAVREAALAAGARDVVVTRHHALGGAGAQDLAAAVWEAAREGAPGFRFLYPDDMRAPREDRDGGRPRLRGQRRRRAAGGEPRLKLHEELVSAAFRSAWPRPHPSLSHDPALKGRPSGFRVPIRDVRLSAGAGFVTPLLGEMRTMPGLPSRPAGEQIDIDERGEIVGLF